MTKKMREFKEKLKQNAETESYNYRDYLVEKNKLEQCYDFIEKLAILLGDDYELVASCNKDTSRYLIPAGTRDQVTYYGKPVNSFRVSDHWSWYSSLKKCSEERYIQCYSMDVPPAKPRKIPGEATKGQRATQVCIQLKDGMYHHVFGDKYDRVKHTWSWVENSVEAVASMIKA